MPRAPKTLLDRFAKLYHDRNVARKRFARIDKPTFQGVDMDRHRKWMTAADDLIKAETALMKAKVKRYNEMAPMPAYYRVNHGVNPPTSTEPRMRSLLWTEDSPVDNSSNSYPDGIGSLKMVDEAPFMVQISDDEWRRLNEFERRGREKAFYASHTHPYRGTSGRDRFELNYMGELSPLWIDARHPDNWDVPAKYRDVADEASARYVSAHRAADAIQRDVDKYLDWFYSGRLMGGPRRDDIRFKDEKGIEHTPVYDPFHMVSPYYRKQLTEEEYAELTNGL